MNPKFKADDFIQYQDEEDVISISNDLENVRINVTIRDAPKHVIGVLRVVDEVEG